LLLRVVLAVEVLLLPVEVVAAAVLVVFALELLLL
jgi:hypothetical protein